MSRAKFNREEVLEKALHLFWAKGYEATSMRDLVEHLGIPTGSIYQAWGNKENLFHEAFGAYSQIIVVESVKKLMAESSAKKALGVFFDDLLKNYSSEKAKYGCFMTNGLIELSARESEISAPFFQAVQKLEEVFCLTVKKGIENGELRSEHSAEELALLLVNTFVGMNVLVKSGKKPEELKTIMDMAMDQIF